MQVPVSSFILDSQVKRANHVPPRSITGLYSAHMRCCSLTSLDRDPVFGNIIDKAKLLL